MQLRNAWDAPSEHRGADEGVPLAAETAVQVTAATHCAAGDRYFEGEEPQHLNCDIGGSFRLVRQDSGGAHSEGGGDPVACPPLVRDVGVATKRI